MTELTLRDIEKSALRIRNYITKTPVITNETLNQKLGGQVFFKCENLQKTFSFKARGAFNAVLAYHEKNGCLPKKIVTASSGNHAQALAYVGKLLGIPVLVYMAKNTPSLKVSMTRANGAEVVLCEKRTEANRLAEEETGEGHYFIHPSANDDVIAGQGTACFEAINEVGSVDAVFAPCGGGGLVAGSFLALQGFNKNGSVFGCEPLNANDAARSLRDGKIFAFTESPNTIADGARTLALREPCFGYLKKTSGILEITEDDILNWQKVFVENTSYLIEPTSALAIAGAAQYLSKQNTPNKKVLVIITGGNTERK